MRKNKIQRSVGMAMLCFVAGIIIVPIYMVLINSLKNRTEAANQDLALPKVWQGIENYIEVIKSGNIGTAFINSCITTVIPVIAVITFASMMAFLLQRRKAKVITMLNIFVIVGMIFPVQIIPTYYVTNVLHLPNMAAAVFILITLNLPIAVFLFTGYMKSIPREVDESAWMDGAKQWTLFWRIVFPLLKPVTVTVVILTFMAAWNDFGIAIYFLNNSKTMTLPLTIYSFTGTFSSEWQLVFANVVLATLPVAVLYLALQKYIMAGMTAGAVKG